MVEVEIGASDFRTSLIPSKSPDGAPKFLGCSQ